MYEHKPRGENLTVKAPIRTHHLSSFHERDPDHRPSIKSRHLCIVVTKGVQKQPALSLTLQDGGGKGRQDKQTAGYLIVYRDIENIVGVYFLDDEVIERCLPEVKRNPRSTQQRGCLFGLRARVACQSKGQKITQLLYRKINFFTL